MIKRSIHLHREPGFVPETTESAQPDGSMAVLPTEIVEELSRMGQVRAIPRNTIVVIEGEPAEALYVVMAGKLSVYVSDEAGNEAELNQLGPGEYFGELMLGSSVRTASVRTLEPSRLSMIRRDIFEAYVRDQPDVAYHMIRTLIHRIRMLTETVQSLSLLDVYGRVIREFDNALESDGEGGQFVIGLSQQRIADRVGASKSMINRILKDLTEGGYITVSRQRIDVLKPLPKKW